MKCRRTDLHNNYVYMPALIESLTIEASCVFSLDTILNAHFSFAYLFSYKIVEKSFCFLLFFFLICLSVRRVRKDGTRLHKILP